MEGQKLHLILYPTETETLPDESLRQTFLMLSLSLPVYQVTCKLDWLPLYCLDSVQPAELPRQLSW